MTKTYTTDDYKRMLIRLLDAHYGGAVHNIGNGDGLTEEEAGELREFWSDHLTDWVKQYADLRKGRPL